MRAMLVAAAAVLAILFGAGTAVAQGGPASPFCTAVDGLDVGVAPNGSTNNTATGATNGSRTVRVTWTDAELPPNGGGFIRLNGTIVHNITTASGSVDVPVPDGNATLAFTFIGNANGGQILFECVTTATPPTPPTTPTPTSDAQKSAAAINGALEDQADQERLLWEGMIFGALGFAVQPPLTQAEYDARMAELLRREEARRAAGGASERLDSDTFGGSLIYDEAERHALEASPFHQSAASNYLPVTDPSPSDPELAISRYVATVPQSFAAEIPLASSIPGWIFQAKVSGSLIDQTFAALNRRTSIGRVSLMGITQIDDVTRFGIDLKVRGATTFDNELPSVVNSTYVGADIAILRLLTPNLSAGLMAGYEHGIHGATIAGIDSSFPSHTITGGATLRGEFDHGELTFAPSLDALFRYRDRPGFTDMAGVAIPGAVTIDFDLIAGVTVSRDFLLPESAMVVTPYLGADLMLDYSTTTPAPVATGIPSDTVKAALKGGLKVAWDSGATLSLEGRVTRGATTTAAGITAGLTVPIN